MTPFWSGDCASIVLSVSEGKVTQPIPLNTTQQTVLRASYTTQVTIYSIPIATITIATKTIATITITALVSIITSISSILSNFHNQAIHLQLSPPPHDSPTYPNVVSPQLTHTESEEFFEFEKPRRRAAVLSLQQVTLLIALVSTVCVLTILMRFSQHCVCTNNVQCVQHCM